MLHLCELQVLCCIVLLRETERLWEIWFIAKTAFPSLPWASLMSDEMNVLFDLLNVLLQNN